MVPLASTAQVWVRPLAIETGLEIPETVMGLNPQLYPQQLTLPFANSAQAWLAPVAIDTALEMP